MEEKHRKAIQRNFNSLLEQTDLDLVVSSLYEKGVFTDIMIEPYRDTNRDERTRKRLLYRDIERRGPHAFQHLVATLTELGYWNLVHLLTPDSFLKPYNQTVSIRNTRPPSASSTSKRQEEARRTPPPSLPNPPPRVPPSAPPPAFTVVKSTKFHDGRGCYSTRSRRRGIALIVTIARFDHGTADPRSGAHVDHANLKELFHQIGFHQILAYTDVTCAELKQTIVQFTQLAELERTECVFVVVGSHGYARSDTNDVDIRCKDGKLLSSYFILQQFNNYNCPRLHNIPKVFVFQTCRGSEEDTRELPSSRVPASLRPPETDGATPVQPDRLYSDMLIAHATIPGFVSYRDPLEGSWYVQAMCRVFAERAHDTHVDDLFMLADELLREDSRPQTSSVDRWGFNKRLYLHPGLFEDSKS